MRDELGKDESEEEFDDIEVSGGRAWTGAAARRELVAAAGCDLDGAIRGGDERVKSNSSTSLRDGWSSLGAGIGVGSIADLVSCNFVGVTEARHASSVVCLVFPGEIGTDTPRDGLATSVLFVRFGSSCDGEGSIGELSRSSVSTISAKGGVFGRPIRAPISDGSVCDRCIGARLLRLVTLGGSSGRTGEGDFWRGGRGAGAGLFSAIGDEDSKSITFSSDREFACDRLSGVSCVFAKARESFEPGFVTFANRSIGAWGVSPVVFVRFALLALEVLAGSCTVAARLGFCFVCLLASQSSTVKGTPTFTIDSMTHILAGL
jgi:hypothetical protein